MSSQCQCQGVLRRGFLGGAAASAVVAAVPNFAIVQSALAQTRRSPDSALQALLDGNQRFVAQHLQAFIQDMAALRHKTEDKQEPFASLLSCADSRVPVEILFDQSIGALFVTRVAGNIGSPEIVAS